MLKPRQIIWNARQQFPSVTLGMQMPTLQLTHGELFLQLLEMHIQKIFNNETNVALQKWKIPSGMFSPAGTVCNATSWIQTGWVFLFCFLIFSFRSSQILSSFFLLLCQLLPGNFSLCGGTGQGTRPPLDWLPAPSPSNQARHCDALQRAAHQPATFVPTAPVTSGTGGVTDATIPAYPHNHWKAVAGTQ